MSVGQKEKGQGMQMGGSWINRSTWEENYLGRESEENISVYTIRAERKKTKIQFH